MGNRYQNKETESLRRLARPKIGDFGRARVDPGTLTSEKRNCKLRILIDWYNFGRGDIILQKVAVILSAIPYFAWG